jgi:hypothetical protein
MAILALAFALALCLALAFNYVMDRTVHPIHPPRD